MTLSTWIHAVFRRVRVSPSEENEILIFKPRHDTISVISIESTVGRRTRDGWNINADISLLCGSLTTPPPLPHTYATVRTVAFKAAVSGERYCTRPFPSRYILIALNSQRTRVFPASSRYMLFFFLLTPGSRQISSFRSSFSHRSSTMNTRCGIWIRLVCVVSALSSIFKNHLVIRMHRDVGYGNHVLSVNTAGRIVPP